jgi:predicted homoserine dehydrogenase-like protein
MYNCMLLIVSNFMIHSEIAEIFSAFEMYLLLNNNGKYVCIYGCLHLCILCIETAVADSVLKMHCNMCSVKRGDRFSD